LLFSLIKVFICYFWLNIKKNFYIAVTFGTDVLSNPTTITSGSYSYYFLTSGEVLSGAVDDTAAFNYYPVMQRFVLNTGITAAADFNYYAAI